MTKIKNFYDLDVWQKAHKFTLEIYKVTEAFPQNEIFGITSQIRRASSSIAANISEGFSRYHFKDKNKFYYQARGSISEVQNFIFLTKDLNFLSIEKSRELYQETIHISKLLNGLIRSNQNKINSNS